MTSHNTPEVDQQLQPGDAVHFHTTFSIQRDSSLFSEPIVTRRGMELELTKAILDVYGYPEKPSWLTRLGEPNRNGVVLADRGPWPSDRLKTVPGTFEHQQAKDAAVAEVWQEYGPDFSAEKNAALKAVDKTYGETTDSWTAVNEAWKKNGARR